MYLLHVHLLQVSLELKIRCPCSDFRALQGHRL